MQYSPTYNIEEVIDFLQKKMSQYQYEALIYVIQCDEKFYTPEEKEIIGSWINHYNFLNNHAR